MMHFGTQRLCGGEGIDRMLRRNGKTENTGMSISRNISMQDQEWEEYKSEDSRLESSGETPNQRSGTGHLSHKEQRWRDDNNRNDVGLNA